MVQNLHKEMPNDVSVAVQYVNNVKDIIFLLSPWNKQNLHK